MSAETWPRILFQYGPFALLVFLVFFGLRRAQENKDKALASRDRRNQRDARLIYGVVWLVTIGCVVVSVYVWLFAHTQRYALLRGELANLRRDARVQFERDEVYSQSFILADRDRQKIDWVFVSEGGLVGPTDIVFTHEATGQTAHRFSLRVPQEVPAGRIKATYEGGTDTFQLFLPGSNQAQTITPLEK